jgi:diguanylate cyclase (GGDEF)-like protein
MSPYRDDPAILIIAEASIAERIAGFLRAGGSALSAVMPQVAAAPEQIADEIQRNLPQNTLVIASISALSPQWQNWLDTVYTHSYILPVVVAGGPEIAGVAQQAGVACTVVLNDLTPDLLTSFISMAQAIHALKYQQTQLQHMYDMAQNRFRDMADQFADWLWEVDTNLHLTFSSARKRPAQAAAKGALLTSCFLPEERLRIEDDFAELLKSPRPFHDRDYWSADAYGTRLCWSVSGVPIYNHVQHVVGFRGVAQDISPARATTDQLYYLANHDTLTGVTNRNRFYDELARTIRIAKRENRTGALLITDIDRFAFINQTHGHEVGDKFLIHMAQVLKDNIRTGDMLARLDGDQFAILLRDVRAEDLTPRLERLKISVANRPMQHEKATLTLTLSGGAAMYPLGHTGGADDPDALLANAQDALAKAKQRGPGKFEVYNPNDEATASAPDQLEWVEFVSECLGAHNERMVLHYQPIVPLNTNQHTIDNKEYYEVLVRLVDKDGHIVPPARFITTAEDFGLVTHIDKLVTTRAIGMLQEWLAVGRKVHLSVNLSGKTFDDTGYLSEVSELLKHANLPEKSLVFEITETALLRDLPTVKNFMATLRACGAGFALDDCGVGYSSFNYIRHLDLDFIKIDGSFVKNLHASADDQAFVKALADVAKQKNIATVAEMVEHEAAMQGLQKLGIDFGQGFYFAAPAPELPAPENFSPNRWRI